MASYVQQLQQAIAAAKRLSENIRGDLLGVRDRVKKERTGIVGPIAGSHLAEEADAYLAQIDDQMRRAQAAAEALIRRLERGQSQAGTI